MEDISKIQWPGWETTRLIGRGSFGAVYEIKRTVLGGEEEFAAMKVISIPQSDSDIEELVGEGYDNKTISTMFEDHRTSIVGEYSTMKKMSGSHNIVACDDIKYFQHEDGIGWDILIKMELLTPLIKALPQSVDDNTVINVGMDICSALEICEENDIVHRDIKPQNIFLSKYGDYKLGDFGIAKTVEKTTGGTKIGTYDYMSPEVYNNKPYGGSADIYSLGLVLYWLLNNRRLPFLPQPPEMPTSKMKETARLKRFHGDEIPEPVNGSAELKKIVLKACSFDAEDRFVDATEMKQALMELYGGVIIPRKKEVKDPIEIQKKEIEIVPVDIYEKNTDSLEELGNNDIPSFSDENEPTKYTDDIETDSDDSEDFEDLEDGFGNKKKTLIAIVASLAVIIIAAIAGFAITKGGFKPTVTFPADETKVTDVFGDEKSTTDESTTEESTTEETNEEESTEETTTEESTTKETLPVQKKWSAWSDELPDYVNKKDYKVEERTLYKSKKLKKESSTNENAYDGWDKYKTVDGRGDYGEWSEWSETKVTKSDTVDVQSETRYRYKTKETKTSSSSTMSGWNLYKTTYSWSDYGAWSDWSTTPVYNSDSRKVETKKQYSYRDITYETKYTDWSSWSGWQDSAISETNLRDVETRTLYPYYYFYCKKCGDRTRWYSYGQPCGACGTTMEYKYNNIVWLTNPWSEAVHYRPYGRDTGKYAIHIDTLAYWTWTDGNPKNQYRSRTRSTKQEAVYSNWSKFYDTVYYNSSTREVQDRTVYRYCDRKQIPTYHFERWSDWSDWSTTPISENENRKVDKQTFYRSRERVYVKTYYFKKWSNWSDWSTTPVSASDEVKVETKKEYRFKSK